MGADRSIAATSLATYLLHLLRDEPEYRRQWLQRPADSGRSRLEADVNRMAIARTVFAFLVDETWGETEQTLDSLKHRIYRTLNGGPTHESTIGWILDAFDMTDEHRDQVWSLFAAARARRRIEGTPRVLRGLDPVDWTELRPLRALSQTVSAHEHHAIGADRRPSTHRTLQIVRALEDGVETYPYLWDAGSAELSVIHGGTVAEVREVATPPFLAAIIRYDRPLRAGETHSMELLLDFSYPEVPEPVFQKGVIGGQSTNIGLRLSFHPDGLPKRVRLVEWPNIQADPLALGDVGLDSDHSTHQFYDRLKDRIVGFAWDW